MPVNAAAYEARKEEARRRNAAMALAGREIGPLPAVADPDRKEAARLDFRSFCDSYFPERYYLPWSDDHLRIIAKIEGAVLHGRLFALAMPRGSGKTSLCETACLWVVLYGHRDFVALIGSDEGHAGALLDSIKTEVEVNPLLAEDFPEVCFPIERLEGIHNRSAGQIQDGTRTQISWTAREIVLPSIAGSAAAGAVVRTAGITGGIRGMKFTRPDGRSVRPSLVVIDDPQTDESAHSPSQCAAREAILSGAILGLAGPGRQIAGIMPCTVISPGDMADAILDREKHPEWHGERTKLIYSFPTNEALWEQYTDLRRQSLRAGHQGEEATEFYRVHRQEMDAGAVVAWPARHNPDELSALQHAQNLLADRGKSCFWSEYQNEPLPEQPTEDLLSPAAIAGRVNRLPRGRLPLAATHLTCFVDVQERLLYWLACAWSDDFTGWIVDYGTWPGQRRPQFNLRDVRTTLVAATKIPDREGSIYAGLERLSVELLSRDWPREDGALLRVERCLVDSGWGEMTELVKTFCRQSAFAATLLPSRGHYVGAASRPFAEYTRHPGDKVGLNWRMPAVQGRAAVRTATYDANFWKSFVHGRLATPLGSKGALTLFGEHADQHRHLAEHLTAEFKVRTEGRGRTVEEWKLRPEKPDNHWLDCLVGCAVAGSILGASLLSAGESSTSSRRGLSFADMRKRR